MTTRDLGALILLGVLWGASFLFIRVAVPVFGPFALVELRVGIAVVALLVYGSAGCPSCGPTGGGSWSSGW